MSNLRNVKTAQYQAKLLYGADIKDDDFEELVLVALPQIGNHHTELKTVRLNLDDNLCVDLPCDCKLIMKILGLVVIYMSLEILEKHILKTI